VLAQPVWRDLLAGYTLLLDDCLAPGDEVVINSAHTGTVTQLSLRGVRLKVGETEHVWIRNGEVRSVASHVEPASPAEERP
ncbi:MAG: mechanosensitive ion channel, partial [Armatimonadetes bacterium]|nr:mechanosensitive ion channel [Armatimonadota bacterium]